MAHPKVRTKQEAIELLREFRQRLIQERIHVEQMILFGSFAKNANHEWSDIDVAVVSPSFGVDKFEERNRLMRLSEDISSAIEPHPFTEDDLRNRWSSLSAEILQHGVKVE